MARMEGVTGRVSFDGGGPFRGEGTFRTKKLHMLGVRFVGCLLFLRGPMFWGTGAFGSGAHVF